MIKYLLAELMIRLGLYDRDEAIKALRFDIEHWKTEYYSLSYGIRKLEEQLKSK